MVMSHEELRSCGLAGEAMETNRGDITIGTISDANKLTVITLTKKLPAGLA